MLTYGIPPELCGAARAQRKVSLQEGDRFALTADLRVATERCFLADGRGMCADKRVGGSGASCKAKETRGCQVLARACRQLSTREWNVTQVCYEYTLCSGGTKNASSRALLPEATKFFRSNKNMTASTLKDSLESLSGRGELSGRSASHLRKTILGTGNMEVATSYTMLESLLEFRGYKCGGSVTDC